MTKGDVAGEKLGGTTDEPVALIRSGTLPTAAVAPKHVATEFFAARLQELMAGMSVRDLTTGRMRKLTPRRLQLLLKEQAPQLALSQTQVYRYFHGDAAPDVEVLYEIAHLFGVSPTYFVPE